MFVKFKVAYYVSDEGCVKTDTGLLFGFGQDEGDQYMDAVGKLYDYYGKGIESISIEPFAPDEPLLVKEETLEQLSKEVIW